MIRFVKNNGPVLFLVMTLLIIVFFWNKEHTFLLPDGNTIAIKVAQIFLPPDQKECVLVRQGENYRYCYSCRDTGDTIINKGEFQNVPPDQFVHAVLVDD